MSAAVVSQCCCLLGIQEVLCPYSTDGNYKGSERARSAAPGQSWDCELGSGHLWAGQCPLIVWGNQD